MKAEQFSYEKAPLSLKNRAKTVAFFKIMIYNIKAVCRDGGAVERARFEIVLCRNVYKGSNPFLCATKKAPQEGAFFVAPSKP